LPQSRPASRRHSNTVVAMSDITSNITPGHVRAFQALTTGSFGEVTLTSCTINGEQGVAIIALQYVGEDKVAVCPLFVAILPSMKIVLPGEREGDGDGDEEGPQRSTKESFDITRDILKPR
jgi:hypothetical protein